MCGIGFVMKMGTTPINKTQLDALLIGLQGRGRDASGVALMTAGGEMSTCKYHDSAQMFVDSKRYKDYLAEKLTDEVVSALVHTRLATCGHWSKNDNNHPLVGDNVTLVHNGVIHNHKELFEELHLEPKCETDSDILRAIVDRDGLEHVAVRNLHQVSGSAAIATFDIRQPTRMLIARSGNPLEVALTDDFIIGSSLKQPVIIASRTWTKKWGFYAHKNSNRLDWVATPVDTAWLLDSSGDNPGLQWHQEFKTAPYVYKAGKGKYNFHYLDGWDERDWEKEYGPDTWDKKKSEDSKTTTRVIDVTKQDMRDTGISYECKSCKKASYVPMYLEKDKYNPEKITCSHCQKHLVGARMIVTRPFPDRRGQPPVKVL